jgi:hypothetical protein
MEMHKYGRINCTIKMKLHGNMHYNMHYNLHYKR